MTTTPCQLVWFRRDLRLDDHAALHYALRRARSDGGGVYCVFVFDSDILDPLLAAGRCADRRVEFIHGCLRELDAELRRLGGGLIVLHGPAQRLVPQLAHRLGAVAVHANRDYEPDAIARDRAVAEALQACGIAFRDYKDQVIFERDEVLTAAGTPFSVFTPYRNAWLKRLQPADVAAWPVRELAAALLPPAQPDTLPTLASLGFIATNLAELRLPIGMSGAQTLFGEFQSRIDRYHTARDFPAAKGPSYLSVHLRFGTLSIRTLVGYAVARGGAGAECWLSELIWREFYQQLLWHHPRVADHAFRAELDAVAWDSGPRADALLDAWCAGRTGYPLVDAGMRQLAQTGYLHNRLRMLTASFLCKDLGIDWRRGARHFALYLNDYDLAANNGGWQWAASTGCDAQPWFRIFNPVAQSRKFDADGAFIRRYVPELRGFSGRHIHAPWQAGRIEQEAAGCIVGRDYPAPVVDHALARERTLARFGGLNSGVRADGGAVTRS